MVSGGVLPFSVGVGVDVDGKQHKSQRKRNQGESPRMGFMLRRLFLQSFSHSPSLRPEAISCLLAFSSLVFWSCDYRDVDPGSSSSASCHVD